MFAPVRSFTTPATWLQVDGKQIWMGDVGEEADGHRMSVGFARFADGESAGIPAPYDEVWIVAAGRLEIRGVGEPLHATTGDIVYVPAATPGTVHGADGLQLVLAANPPRWTFTEADWEQVRAEPRADATPRRFTVGEADGWQWVDDQPDSLSYAADEAAGLPFGVGFIRNRRTMAVEFRFPYDEIGVAFRGGFTVESEGTTHTVPTGGLVYLPTGSSGTFHAEAGAELLFAHYPTRAQGVREWDSELPLLPDDNVR